MIKLTIFQVDAFTDRLFGGNPAAVIPLDSWLPDETMQKIALENNLSETAFFVREKEGYHIRWFTPGTEVDLCGHATLATAYVMFNHLTPDEELIEFRSRSGLLKVRRDNAWIELDFPADDPVPVAPLPEIVKALGCNPIAWTKGKTDYLLLFEKESDLINMHPDFGLLGKTEARGIIVSAPGTQSDFVSRFFGPRVGINEDPVTGSAHTMLVPYWHKKTGKETFIARQLSSRQGFLRCKLAGNRVLIAGQAVLYLEGTLIIS